MAQVEELMGTVLIGSLRDYHSADVYVCADLRRRSAFLESHGLPGLVIHVIAICTRIDCFGGIIETVPTAFCIQFVYVYLILHFADVGFLAKIYRIRLSGTQDPSFQQVSCIASMFDVYGFTVKFVRKTGRRCVPGIPDRINHPENGSAANELHLREQSNAEHALWFLHTARTS
ncbi:hypothetical protein A0H81_10645 [Grifola frondosa]|uniref:Uncharacterized protein n=1 Tax=Grifola frondosa TaxID=5627 RepID=A0A1C7LZJ2_GRIFR|nr:hypothetical protein A0H81_10645 [Grifola frondosa]